MTRRASGGGPSTEVKKSYGEILEQEIEAGEKELERPALGLIFSGVAAGLDIGFSVLVIAVLTSQAQGELPHTVLELLLASAYSVGFVLVIFGRSELFTEHTTLAVLPVLARRSGPRQLARLWALVYVSNLVGGAIFAALLAYIGPALDVVEPGVFGEMAARVVDPRPGTMFVSAMLAGWMMGLVSWLVTAARETISGMLFVWLVTGSIGLTHLHHVIVGSIEVLTSIFAGEGPPLADFARFLAVVSTGNTVGGVVFVALLRFAHAAQDSRKS